LDKRHDFDAEILDYYGGGFEEGRLLGGAQGRLEYLRTMELLSRFLPPAPATVLDVGGGAGAYALPLARDDYSVHLIDPVPLHVEQAKSGSLGQPEAPLAGAEVGDARSLSQMDASADAVLLLGPLYHLTARDDRFWWMACSGSRDRPGRCRTSAPGSKIRRGVRSCLPRCVVWRRNRTFSA
jgi:hypothetical protein